TDATRRAGDQFPGYSDYQRLVNAATTWDRLRVLRRETKPPTYQLSQMLELEGRGPVLSVRVLIYPSFIRDAMTKELERAALLSVLSILGSAITALLFYGYAFKPLGRVHKMLDSLARGDYQPGDRQGREDELGAVISTVNLLGERLGGFERLLDQMEEAMLLFGHDGQLNVASGALEKFFGKRRAELMGKRVDDLFPHDQPVGLLLDQLRESGRPIRNWRVAWNHNLPPGALSEALVSVEILEGARDRSGLLVRLRDPEVRRQIQGQLQMAERLTAIHRTTGGVAHEVKNPLNAILMHVELARMKMARGQGDVDEHMEIVSREIVRLDRVVRTFLDFTRPVKLNLASTPIDRFVAEVADLARPQAEASGVTVEVDGKAADAVIDADRDMLKQAVLNIVVNAIEAMGSGGLLRMETTAGSEEAEIRVSDTGPGIPPELRERIFQLYFTTKEKGTGIGLAMTFRMVQLHGGKIEFSSDAGKGTTFLLRFPLASAS
ncbi:MAG: two-component system sensor histidine kinase NtrB, partial [Bryobacteraceae bacterium]